MLGAIEQSCDVYFYELGKKLNVDDIAESANKFGLGQRHNIGLDGEASGIVPTKAWKRSALGESWQGGETLNTSIGQGFLLATPLQLAVMTARIANSGHEVSPVLIKGRDDTGNDPYLPRMDVSDRALRLVQKGMIRVTEGKRGTARGSRLRFNKFRMAGKTGTSQVRRITDQERATRVRKNEEKPWEERDHSLFVAYAPIDDPLYAISVVVEHGGSGSRVAGPLARDIMEQVLKRDPEGVLAARQGSLNTDPGWTAEVVTNG
jgi:penicillin-binding protein 2